MLQAAEFNNTTNTVIYVSDELTEVPRAESASLSGRIGKVADQNSMQTPCSPTLFSSKYLQALLPLLFTQPILIEYPVVRGMVPGVRKTTHKSDMSLRMLFKLMAS